MLKYIRKVNGGVGETYKLSGHSYVTAPPGTDLGSGAYKLVVKVYYDNDPTAGFSTPGFSEAEIDWDTWQYREVEFTTTDTYWKFEMYAKFDSKPDTAIAWFDDMRLVRQSP